MKNTGTLAKPCTLFSLIQKIDYFRTNSTYRLLVATLNKRDALDLPQNVLSSHVMCSSITESKRSCVAEALKVKFKVSSTPPDWLMASVTHSSATPQLIACRVKYGTANFQTVFHISGKQGTRSE